MSPSSVTTCRAGQGGSLRRCRAALAHAVLPTQPSPGSRLPGFIPGAIQGHTNQPDTARAGTPRHHPLHPAHLVQGHGGDEEVGLARVDNHLRRYGRLGWGAGGQAGAGRLRVGGWVAGPCLHRSKAVHHTNKTTHATPSTAQPSQGRAALHVKELTQTLKQQSSAPCQTCRARSGPRAGSSRRQRTSFGWCTGSRCRGARVKTRQVGSKGLEPWVRSGSRGSGSPQRLHTQRACW